MAKLDVALLRRTQRMILQNPTCFDITQDPQWSIEGWVLTAAGIDADRLDSTDDIYC